MPPINRFPLCQVHAERNRQRNTHHELHDIDPKVFLYHSTDSDASGPEPVQELGVRRIDGELDVLLQGTRSRNTLKGLGVDGGIPEPECLARRPTP